MRSVQKYDQKTSEVSKSMIRRQAKCPIVCSGQECIVDLSNLKSSTSTISRKKNELQRELKEKNMHVHLCSQACTSPYKCFHTWDRGDLLKAQGQKILTTADDGRQQVAVQYSEAETVILVSSYAYTASHPHTQRDHVKHHQGRDDTSPSSLRVPTASHLRLKYLLPGCTTSLERQKSMKLRSSLRATAASHQHTHLWSGVHRRTDAWNNRRSDRSYLLVQDEELHTERRLFQQGDAFR